VKTAPLVAAVIEARNVLRALEDERKVKNVGPIVVGGMLADQLAKELAAGASTGSIAVADDPRGLRASLAIRIVAGDPSPEDDRFVRAAERGEIPVVIVQLWPQANWRGPYVLTPFVVECKTGEGFPIRKIAEVIATAADDATSLAARIPVLQQPVTNAVRRDSIVRSAIVGGSLGKKSAARRVLALEQVGAMARLRALHAPETDKSKQLPVAAGTAVATIGASYGFREIARALRGRVPRRVGDAAVAGGGTWLLAEISRRLEARGLI
jgi:hypothetical protein